MGCYINPQNETKEMFLEEHGTRISLYYFRTFKEFDGLDLPVCLVHNGMFTAAAIAYNEGEISAFTDPSDVRPKKFYLVAKEDLRKVAPLDDYLK